MGLLIDDTCLLSSPYVFLLHFLCINKATIVSTTNTAIATSTPTPTPAPTAAAGKEVCLSVDPRDMVVAGTKLVVILAVVETAPAPVVLSEGEITVVAEVLTNWTEKVRD